MNTALDQNLLECGHTVSAHQPFASGYGADSAGNRYCYECCAKRDRQSMRETGRALLYLTHDAIGLSGYSSAKDRAFYLVGAVTNWPGSLSLPCRVKRGNHNIAGTRYDVWFTFEGQTWHGVQYGENTQICHCKRLKAKG